jgi:Mn2+/Fe2+ NRAMP family transporter
MYSGSSMRWSTASLLISFPVFLWMARLVARQVTQDPIARLSPVRRWLTYLTLFLAAIAFVGDVITLVYNLLGGEITLRFLLKVLVVAVVSSAIFGYYLLDLRRGESA